MNPSHAGGDSVPESLPEPAARKGSSRAVIKIAFPKRVSASESQWRVGNAYHLQLEAHVSETKLRPQRTVST